MNKKTALLILVILTTSFWTKAQVDLELEKTVNNVIPNVGDTITFKIEVTNNGLEDATGVSIEDHIPNGYSNVANISDGGTLNGNIITWSGLDIPLGATIAVTFDTRVEAPNPGIDYVNIAEVTASDQPDSDSTPDNDDGDQSEDDEDNEGSTPQRADLELIKTVDIPTPKVGDKITITIEITNQGPADATGISFEDIISNGFSEFSNISDGGIINGDTISWENFNIPAGESISVSYVTKVTLPGEGITYKSIGQVTTAGQFDPDSTPNNDDGDQSEDDEYLLEIPTPDCITIIPENLNCDNNGTNANSEDDTYTFSLHIANGPGDNWINNFGESDTYDVTYDYGPFPIANGPQNLVFIDLDSISCNFSIEIQPPNTCSTDDCDMVVNYTFTPPSCYGSNDGIVQVMVEGGIPNYDTYYWNGNEYEAFEFGFNYGQDSLIFYIEDAFGCILRDTVATPVPAPLEVNINPILQPDCADQEGGILLAEVSGDAPPFNYSWNTGSTSVVITNLTPDTYALTVTDANDCIVTNSIQLSPALNAEAGANQILPCVSDTSIRIGEFYESPVTFSNTPIEIQVKDVPGIAPPPQIINGNISIGFATDTIEWDTNFDGTSLILGSTQAWPSDTIWVPVQVYGFEEIASFSFTIDHEESFMNTLSTAYTNSEVSGFNTSNINFLGAPDFVTVSWDHPDAGQGASLQDGDTLLMLAYMIEEGLLSSSHGNGVQYNWTGPNNFSTNELAPLVNEPGTYYFSITSENISNCIATDSILVSQPSLSIQLEQISITCDSVLLSNSFINEEDIEFLWVYPDGSTSNEDSIGSKQNGYHYLTISGVESGCSVQDSFLVSLGLDNCVLLEGRLVHDLSEDCISNMDEPGLANWLISIQSSGNTFYAVTQAGGYYKQYLPTGTYEVVPLLPNALWELCDDSYAQVMEEPGEVYLLDMPILEAEPCPELSVALSFPLLRRCTTRTIFINYENSGTEKATDALVTVELDEQFIYLSASLPLIDQQDHAYTFKIGDIDINETGQFSVLVYVKCDTPIGSTLCAEAIIIPNETCEAIDPLWSGASLAVEGRCEGDKVVFKVKNNGTGNMIQSSPSIIVEDGVMFRIFPDSLRLDANEDYDYELPARGTTYRFEIEQVVNHPGMSHPVAVVEGCGLNYQGTFSTGFVNPLFMDDDDEFVDIECREVMASFDPNDKHGFPRGYGAEHLINPNQPIEYLINFQNTGNDTAFTIVIRDTLSMYLDITTVRPGAASHNYTWDIDNDNILTFTFENILLPDSTTSYAASQGFIEYKISPYNDLPYDQFDIIIENQAAIFFDSNEAVLTNSTNHKLGKDFIEWSLAPSHSERSNTSVKVVPNPAQKVAEFILNEWPAGTKYFELFDNQGRPVHHKEFIGKKYQLYCEHLPKGLYFFSIIDKKGGQVSGQLVIL
ncbi:MAG: T9SS type A sorting domain-containing protein [Chitinophagales bacterium]|nr:T9SS type A sorting domain-containing protein [Chitinophagales bacterium]